MTGTPGRRVPGRRASTPGGPAGADGRAAGAGRSRGVSAGSTAERFAQRARDARRRSRVAAVVAGVVALLAVALLWLVRFSPVLDVERVRVTGVSAALASQVQDAAGPLAGRPLAAVDLSAVGARAAGVLGVEKVVVEREWPHTVHVSATARTPVLAVTRGKGQPVDLIDGHGVVFASSPSAPQDVPTVAAGKAADGRALAGAVSMMAALPADLRAKVSNITVTSASAMSFSLGDVTVRWGDSSQPELKVKVLQALLTRKPAMVDVSAPTAPATS